MVQDTFLLVFYNTCGTFMVVLTVFRTSPDLLPFKSSANMFLNNMGVMATIVLHCLMTDDFFVCLITK